MYSNKGLKSDNKKTEVGINHIIKNIDNRG